MYAGSDPGAANIDAVMKNLKPPVPKLDSPAPQGLRPQMAEIDGAFAKGEITDLQRDALKRDTIRSLDDEALVHHLEHVYRPDTPTGAPRVGAAEELTLLEAEASRRGLYYELEAPEPTIATHAKARIRQQTKAPPAKTPSQASVPAGQPSSAQMLIDAAEQELARLQAAGEKLPADLVKNLEELKAAQSSTGTTATTTPMTTPRGTTAQRGPGGKWIRNPK